MPNGAGGEGACLTGGARREPIKSFRRRSKCGVPSLGQPKLQKRTRRESIYTGNLDISFGAGGPTAEACGKLSPPIAYPVRETSNMSSESFSSSRRP